MTKRKDVAMGIRVLEMRRQQLDARLAGMRARAVIQDKKREDRRRYLAGGVLLALLEREDAMRLVARALLERNLVRPADRELFEFE